MSRAKKPENTVTKAVRKSHQWFLDGTQDGYLPDEFGVRLSRDQAIYVYDQLHEQFGIEHYGDRRFDSFMMFFSALPPVENKSEADAVYERIFGDRVRRIARPKATAKKKRKAR